MNLKTSNASTLLAPHEIRAALSELTEKLTFLRGSL